MRRVSLDLVGMPPTADEARAFIADEATDKRERLIDRLFASPQFARHLAAVLDLMLMERRPNTNVTADEWQAWLLKCVRENMPWNLLVREILAADGDDPRKRPRGPFCARSRFGPARHHARYRPDLLRSRHAVCPVPRSPADRRLSAVRLSRHAGVCVAQLRRWFAKKATSRSRCRRRRPAPTTDVRVGVCGRAAAHGATYSRGRGD